MTAARQCRHPSAAPPRRPRLAWIAVAVLAAAAGCAAETLDDTYGRRAGTAGGKSVNGTRVLADMFRSAGHRVATWRRLSPGIQQYDVIVWTPDDFLPPGIEQRRFLEDWLAHAPGRTLIYIGRDYDAEIAYWEAVQAEAPPQQAGEIARRLARARAEFHNARMAIPERQYVRWFTVCRGERRRTATALSGPWAEGIDPAATEIEIGATLAPPTAEDAAADDDAAPLSSFPWEVQWNPGWWVPDELPDEVEVLLAADEEPLVIRVRDQRWRDWTGENSSQVIAVSNGSFLLNLPLVNHEHRKLAGRLIDELGPERRRVAFLESGPGGPAVLSSEPGDSSATGLEILTTWPIGPILLHLAAVGILYCFALYPILGRPREVKAEGLSDFGQHVAALGEMMQRTADEEYARQRIEHYQQVVRSESGRHLPGRNRPPAN